MRRTIGVIGAVTLVVAACSASSELEPAADLPTTSLRPTTTAQEPEVGPRPATTVSTTSSQPSATTTVGEASTTVAEASTTTTTPVVEGNPADVEAWWCAAIARAIAAGLGPQDFARDFDDELRHGYTDAPVETVEDAASQLERLQCEPAFAEAVADALIG